MSVVNSKTPRLVESCYRTHTCGALTESEINKRVTLSGWIHRKRDHGGVLFVDLRDNFGITQLVFSGEVEEMVRNIRPESVIKVSGQVVIRDQEFVNPKIATGKVEIKVDSLELLSSSDPLPFQVAEDDHAPEHLRLKYRFLDLRREQVHHNIELRCRVIEEMRTYLSNQGFLEFQTPILTSSSPEGARDFIVPSRLHPGKFYALPQAPQQFKQLLMISGFDRYFQIAPCFRDEDSRADRSPGEFYQLDIEMSFIEEVHIFQLLEGLFTSLFSQFSTKSHPVGGFPRIPYDEAMEKYGSDKPDLRNPLEIRDLTTPFLQTSFRVFKQIISDGGKVRGIAVEFDEFPSRSFFDELIAQYQGWANSGLVYLAFDGSEFKGNIVKLVSADELSGLHEALGKKQKVLVFLAAGKDSNILGPLGKLRTRLANEFKLIDEGRWEPCWITDFPMFEADEHGGIRFMHNPFSMPQGGMNALNETDPLQIKARQYDLVIDGVEVASGSIRNHLPEVMFRAFEIAGYSHEEVETKFGGMLRAFHFGAPPHGGIAPGVERVVMLLAGEHAIRDVVPFPKNQHAEDLLMGAPSNVSKKQLREANIELAPKAVIQPI